MKNALTITLALSLTALGCGDQASDDAGALRRCLDDLLGLGSRSGDGLNGPELLRLPVDSQEELGQLLLLAGHQAGDIAGQAVLTGAQCLAKAVPGQIGGQQILRHPQLKDRVALIGLGAGNVPQGSYFRQGAAVAGFKPGAQNLAAQHGAAPAGLGVAQQLIPASLTCKLRWHFPGGCPARSRRGCPESAPHRRSAT